MQIPEGVLDFDVEVGAMEHTANLITVDGAKAAGEEHETRDNAMVDFGFLGCANAAELCLCKVA